MDLLLRSAQGSGQLRFRDDGGPESVPNLFLHNPFRAGSNSRASGPQYLGRSTYSSLGLLVFRPLVWSSLGLVWDSIPLQIAAV